MRKLLRNLLGRKTTLNQLNIEMCTRCNLRCRYCALDPKREKMFMNYWTYYKVINDILSDNLKIDTLMLSHSAEVLQHPQFERFLELTAMYKMMRPDTHIGMDTNLMLMDKRMVEIINRYHVFDFIVCSIDGHDKESFRFFRPGADYDTVSAGFYRLFNYLPDDVELVLNCGHEISPEPYKEIEFSEDFKELFDIADTTVTFPFHDWDGTILYPPGYQPREQRGRCYKITSQAVVFANGDVGKCCFDLNGNTSYGNIYKQSLKSIINSCKKRKALLLMTLNQRKRVKGCERCSQL